MSRAMKRKHFMREAQRDDFKHPTENQQIVRILRPNGNNLHFVESTDGSTFLVSMPTKYRQLMWVKRGDFVLTEPIEEGDKVKAEIVSILTPQHIKYFKKDNVWPKEFDQYLDKPEEEVDIFVNPNRPAVDDDSESESSDDEDTN